MKAASVIAVSVLALVCLFSGNAAGQTLIDTFNDIYDSCLIRLSVDCVQPKTYEWFNRALQQPEIYITEDLTIVKNATSELNADNDDDENGASARENQFNVIAQVDDFLSTHYLNIRYPKSIITSYVPAFAVSTISSFIPESTQIPLQENSVSEGRGLVKKVLIPFLLGLKFKTTVLLPLAFALIALKAWKALTLGLLSLVVSGAVVVFKLARPKVVNYEVVHYPPHHEHHIDHVHDHVHPHIEHIHPHHLEHIHPHHLEHVHPHHLEHIHSAHIDVPHVDHVHHDHPPNWSPQDIAYAGHLTKK